ncbi:tannase and feruloyl esterase [Xylaria sp. FL1042]|nr:tannase and feruloyl esterase [Xylaria sp. FL1042]
MALLATNNGCAPATFNLSGIFGLEVLDIHATLVTNYSAWVPAILRYTQPDVELSNATFCNITVSYTHPGQNDNIYTEAWLPVDYWNGRFQAVGGGGYAAGRFYLSYAAMEGAIADGYATITTDAGLGDSMDPSTWALLSPGNVNMYNIQNLGSVSLSDEAAIGKSLIKSFYGKGPDFSYWNGCSQGGRQGLMLAQRYPTLYDGIAAGAPAINWNKGSTSAQWPQQFMSIIDSYPYGCELDAITAAAVSACDGLDSFVDGIIAEVDTCLATFDPFQLVGASINCTEADGMISISSTAAEVVNATWSGPYTATGKSIWYGLNPGADITGNSGSSYGLAGVAATNCTAGVCVGVPFTLSDEWFRLFVAKDPDFDLYNITHPQFDSLVHLSQQTYTSVIGTEDPDLSEFRNAGGKLVSFHGLSDQIIPPKGTVHYYNAVAATVPEIDDFYRHFEVPGLGHCFGGQSGQPTNLFSQLRAWVENGTAPTQTSVQITDKQGNVQDRVLCRYPQKAKGKSQRCN